MSKTIWVTKWALTEGIIEAPANPDRFDPSQHKVCYPSKHGYATYIWMRQPDWCETREAAVAQAEQMQSKKIASLERQVERVKTMTFSVVETEADGKVKP